MDKNEVTQLVKEHFDNQLSESQYGNGPVPFHVHNGTDSSFISNENFSAIDTDVLPNVTDSHDLGSTDKEWNNLYVSTVNATTINGDGSGLTNIKTLSSNEFTCSENIAQGASVAMGGGNGYLILDDNTIGTTGDLAASTTKWASQIFTTDANAVSISQVTARLQNTSAGNISNVSLTCSIRANSGNQPTGSDLGGGPNTSSTQTLLNSGSQTFSVTFATPIPVSPNTTYHVIMSTNTTAVNIFYFGSNTGTNQVNASTNSGSTWSIQANMTLAVQVYEVDNVRGKVCNASSAILGSDRFVNYMGFSSASSTTGNSVSLEYGGKTTEVSSSSAGTIYYLNDSLGSISPNTGTNVKKVGLGMPSNQILIYLNS